MRRLATCLGASLCAFAIGWPLSSAAASEPVSLYDGTLKFVLPEEMEEMPVYIQEKKYSRGPTRPEHIYTDANRKIDFGVGLLGSGRMPTPTPSDVEELQRTYERAIPVRRWIAAEVGEFGDAAGILLTFETPAIETDSYLIRNHIAMVPTDLGTLVINFVCTTNVLEQCQGLRDALFRTVQIEPEG